MNLVVKSAGYDKSKVVRLPGGALITCLLDKDTVFFHGLPEEFVKIVSQYRARLKKKEISEPLLFSVTPGGKKRFLLLAPIQTPDKNNENDVSQQKGFSEYYRGESVKTIGAVALKKAAALNLSRLVFLVNTSEANLLIPLLAEGALLGDYRFDRYITEEKKKRKVVEKVIFLCHRRHAESMRRTAEEVEKLCLCVNEARAIINEPGNILTPEKMAVHARRIARKYSLRCRVLNEKALQREGYNGLLTVGAGSKHPPRLILLDYNPTPKGAKKKRGRIKHLCLVGKGITFDSGGLCLKSPRQMWEMKTDMAGAGAALHAVEAAARLSLPIRVSAVVPAAENVVGSGVTLPGNIFRAKNGKTVQVDNTDAEGRLVLTDGLALAETLKPDFLVDLATLTGACVYALGPYISGLFGDDPAFNRQFLELAREAGEACWELPLHAEYQKFLKCEFADLNNIGSIREGGAIHAALFLSQFKPKGVPWIHLDIAGTAMADKEWKYFRPGATGVGIRSIIRLARRLSME